MKRTFRFWTIICISLSLGMGMLSCDDEGLNIGYGLAYSGNGGSSFAGHSGNGGGGGNGGTSTNSNKVIVGTWVYKDSGSTGSIERTYTFKSNGTCHYKDVWVDKDRSDGDSSYTDEEDYSYYVVLSSANAGYVFINNIDFKFEVSGNTLTLGSVKYTKQ